jgi:hypothetical protein
MCTPKHPFPARRLPQRWMLHEGIWDRTGIWFQFPQAEIGLKSNEHIAWEPPRPLNLDQWLKWLLHVDYFTQFLQDLQKQATDHFL